MGNKVARHRMGTRLCNAYFSVLFWFLKYVNELAFIKKLKILNCMSLIGICIMKLSDHLTKVLRR